MGTVYEIDMKCELSASPDAVFALLEAPQHFHEFMPHVRKVTVLESSESHTTAKWETDMDGVPLEWTEEAEYDRGAGSVRFWALDGVFDRFDGSWRIVANTGGSTVSFHLNYEIGLPEIEFLVAPLLRARLNESIQAMLASVETGVEKSL